MLPVSYDTVKQAFAAKGIQILNSPEGFTVKQPILFNCTQCGKQYHISWRKFREGKNKRFLCLDCSGHRIPTETLISETLSRKQAQYLGGYINAKAPLKFRCLLCGKEGVTSWDSITKDSDTPVCQSCAGKEITIEFLQKEFKKRGVELLSTTYKNNRQPLEFKCAFCGKVHSRSWVDVQGVSQLSCPEKVTFERVKSFFASKGVELLSTEYVNNTTPLYFKCTNCGRVHSIRWNSVVSGYNANFLCPICQPFSKPTLEFISQLAKAAGAELYTKQYVDSHQPLEFSCSKCGVHFNICWNNIQQGQNKRFFCQKCSKGNMLRPENSWNKARTHIDKYYLELVKKFFNVADLDVASHHIVPFARDEALRTSFANGFPLWKRFHANTYNDGEVQNPYHMREAYLNPECWPDEAKLPFHNYPGFKFLNLNEHFVTEIVSYDNTHGLFEKKCAFQREGLVYIPLYLEELITARQQEIVFSMLRNRFYKFYPSIYAYTGTNLVRIGARQCEVRELKNSEASLFFQKNHIQGSVNAKEIFGLFYKDELVCAMSFGKPRYNSKYEWELLRFATRVNTAVMGGAQRLFKHFIAELAPNSVLSYCDIRFAFPNYMDTVYPKLGFKLIGRSKPNYRYVHPEENRLFSRQYFQKHKLKDRIEHFDPSLTEEQNLENNGYKRVYDCGNFIFVWEREQCIS